MDELTDYQKKRAEFQYGFTINSDYQKRIPLELDPDDYSEPSLGSYLFDICDHFGLPMTNSPSLNPDSVEMGEFISAVYKAVELAGWVSPKDHQRVVEELRRSAR